MAKCPFCKENFTNESKLAKHLGLKVKTNPSDVIYTKTAKKFGQEIEKLEKVKHGQVQLNSKHRNTLVYKDQNTYSVSQFNANGKEISRNFYTIQEFEENYRWYI